MWIEHPDLGMVPTYGGPYDSYTIPERSELVPAEGGFPRHWTFSRTRFCHDRGVWVGDWETLDLVMVEEAKLLDLID